MGVVLSLVQGTTSLAGSLLGLSTVLFGLHSICAGSALAASLGLRVAEELQEKVLRLSADFLGEATASPKSPQKVAALVLLAPVALLLWMVSLQCYLALRAVATQSTGKVALPLLVANVAIFFAMPPLWWFLMKAVGVTSPAITWGLAEISKKQPRVNDERDAAVQVNGAASAEAEEIAPDE
mmetsp:Transcript_58798/g.137639  ORF Transcript_58798/g.137639 Transcript_58798/m.137639 type:complete len:182 (-) Transcript_58798:23-568(-)|eukprot:s415_g23.t1